MKKTFYVDAEKNGVVYESQVTANSETEAAEFVKKEGFKLLDIEEMKHSHRCKYCGNIVHDSTNEDILCGECIDMFGHIYYSML